MNNKFDELAKGMAQATTRRQALKKFSFGLAAAVAASLGMRNSSAAPSKPRSGYCQVTSSDPFSWHYTGSCVDPSTCQGGTTAGCSGQANAGNYKEVCWPGFFISHKECSF